MLTETHLNNNRFKIITGFLCVLFIVSGLFVVPDTSAQVIKVGAEYKIKAAFVYNLARFTEWPTDSLNNIADSFYIGVLGIHPFKDYLDDIAQEKLIKEKSIAIIYSDSIAEILKCRVVFISTSDQDLIEEIIEKLNGKSILTISDQTEFTRMGGMVNFINVHGKVRFAINIDASKRADLKLSSTLLKLAKIVEDE